MKTLTTQVIYFLRRRPTRSNIASLLRFVAILALIVTLYSVVFHYIMEREGRSYSWITGFYWTLTVMSTLGFGDITFESDLGRAFSILVMISGVVFLLIVFPFTFIEFFYAPWLQAQAEARTPSSLPKIQRDHVILTHYDPLTRAIIRRLKALGRPYALLVADRTQASQLYEEGYRVVVGDLDSPDTYRNLRAENAALVVTTADDRLNVNVAATVREVAEHVPIIATADSPASVDILTLAGCNQVLQVMELMGRAMARRILGADGSAQVVGEINDLQIAEALVTKTALVNQTIAETRLRERVGVSVVGLWEQGVFQLPRPETPLHEETVLVLIGTPAQIEAYNRTFRLPWAANGPVLVIGGGRVGRAAAHGLMERGLSYRIVERDPEQIRNPATDILGDAADLEVLKRAGIDNASGVIVTTHDDDTNIYLTIYCRRLRPDVQIVSRAMRERNIATLYRSGANVVMSYAFLGATAVVNLMIEQDIVLVVEGLDIAHLPIPKALQGKNIAESAVRRRTGCTVVALKTAEGSQVNPDPHLPLPAEGELVLLGTPEAIQTFQRVFPTSPSAPPPPGRPRWSPIAARRSARG